MLDFAEVPHPFGDTDEERFQEIENDIGSSEDSEQSLKFVSQATQFTLFGPESGRIPTTIPQS